MAAGPLLHEIRYGYVERAIEKRNKKAFFRPKVARRMAPRLDPFCIARRRCRCRLPLPLPLAAAACRCRCRLPLPLAAAAAVFIPPFIPLFIPYLNGYTLYTLHIYTPIYTHTIVRIDSIPLPP